MCYNRLTDKNITTFKNMYNNHFDSNKHHKKQTICAANNE